MVDYALEPAERDFLRVLNELGVRYMIVGVTAASMQGARVATEDIDLWFEEVSDVASGKLLDARKIALRCLPSRPRWRFSTSKTGTRSRRAVSGGTRSRFS